MNTIRMLFNPFTHMYELYNGSVILSAFKSEDDCKYWYKLQKLNLINQDVEETLKHKEKTQC